MQGGGSTCICEGSWRTLRNEPQEGIRAQFQTLPFLAPGRPVVQLEGRLQHGFHPPRTTFSHLLFFMHEDFLVTLGNTLSLWGSESVFGKGNLRLVWNQWELLRCSPAGSRGTGRVPPLLVQATGQITGEGGLWGPCFPAFAAVGHEGGALPALVPTCLRGCPFPFPWAVSTWEWRGQATWPLVLTCCAVPALPCLPGGVSCQPHIQGLPQGAPTLTWV